MDHRAQIAVIGCLLTSGVALGAPPPKPGLELDHLVGRWKGTGTLQAGPDVATAAANAAPLQASWTCERTAARSGVLCRFHVTGIPGVPSYEETDLLGYDAASATYHWYSVTNAGETHDHTAPASARDGLRFVFRGSQDGKPLEEVITLAFRADGARVEGRAETFVAGALSSVLSVSLVK